jgi:oligopeptidase B
MSDSVSVPPKAKKIPKTLEKHGDVRIDNYYWLNDRENPEVIAYLNAENAYLQSELAHTKPLQTALFEEIVGRIKQDDATPPYFLGGYYYYTRFEKGKEYAIYCRKKDNIDAPEVIILDVNELAQGTTFCNVSNMDISPDTHLLAYAIDTVGRNNFVIRIKNLLTGETLPDTLTNTWGQMAWANDNKTLFYDLKDETLRAYKIKRHKLGGKRDMTVFHEKDETFNVGIGRSKSNKYIFIASESTETSEHWILEANTPRSKFRCFHPRERGLEYHIDHHHSGKFYVVTDFEAKNFRLMETAETTTAKENWQEVIAHRDNVLLESIDCFQDFLVIEERKEGLTNFRIKNLTDQTEHYIDFGEADYAAGMGTNRAYNTSTVRYAYMSLTTPASTYDYNMATRQKILQKQQEIVGGFDANAYISARIHVTANDGTKVPVSIVHRSDTPLDGSAPCLMYGYGSYGAAMESSFSVARLSLLNRGFVFALTHIRGGNELGELWYENGRQLEKMNTFTDFIACAEHLIAQKYCTANTLFAMGGSAGGLLMGAVTNMRPDLFKGVIAQVPFVDVVTTMLDDTIPLTTGEYDEWGNPNEKIFYDYMKSYSPYDNVTAKNYPNMLITTGLHDSQVQYWEPAKWIAKLREVKTDTNKLLLYTNMEAGHGGKSGRFERFKEVAMEYAFMLDLVTFDPK